MDILATILVSTDLHSFGNGKFYPIIDALNRLGERDIFDFLTLSSVIFVPIIVTIINIYYINKSTANQIRNQNQNTFRPRLRLAVVETIQDIRKHDADQKYLLDGMKILKCDKGIIDFTEFDKAIRVVSKTRESALLKISIKNIGIGVAKNISFLNAINDTRIVSILSLEENCDQVSFSSQELDRGECGDYLFESSFLVELSDFIWIENYKLICKYQDLFNNNYEFIIMIRLKKSRAINPNNSMPIFNVEYSYIQGDSDDYKENKISR